MWIWNTVASCMLTCAKYFLGSASPPIPTLLAPHRAAETPRGCWTGRGWGYSVLRCLHLHPGCSRLLLCLLLLLLLLRQRPDSAPARSPPGRRSFGSATFGWRPVGTCVCGRRALHRKGWWERRGWYPEGCWLLPSGYPGWNTCPAPAQRQPGKQVRESLMEKLRHYADLLPNVSNKQYKTNKH